MAYLKNFIDTKAIKGLSKTASTFSANYDSWVEQLFERAMRLFVWKNTGDVPPREIECTLLANGSGFVTDKYKRSLSIFNGQYSGEPTQYYDMFKSFSVHSPKYSAILKIGKDGVLGRNNALMNSIYPIVHRYAVLLAHTEVSMIDTLINGRDSGGIPIASTEAQRQAIIQYRNALCNGKVQPILDPAFSGVQFIQTGTSNTALDIQALMEVRQELLSAFYNDIGVKTGYKKKGNMIQEEVNSDDAMLLLNISDMLACRKDLANDVNVMYNVNWEVDIAPEIKKLMETGENTNEQVENIKSVEK